MAAPSFKQLAQTPLFTGDGPLRAYARANKYRDYSKELAASEDDVIKAKAFYDFATGQRQPAYTPRTSLGSQLGSQIGGLAIEGLKGLIPGARGFKAPNYSNAFSSQSSSPSTDWNFASGINLGIKGFK